MLSVLKQEKEIAIDLEHHDYRSYLGNHSSLVIVMQIITHNDLRIYLPFADIYAARGLHC